MNKSQKKNSHLYSAPQHVKIIGGRWRGTKLPVILKDNIRPTPARVRETLFNWLQTYIEGSHCLDLFAGSGALGFESASRGAGHISLIDNDPKVVQLLSQQVQKLECDIADTKCIDGLEYLDSREKRFDIVYLDPPFSMFNLEEVLEKVSGSKVMKSEGLIYVESTAEKFPKSLPIGWTWKRQSKAGQVEYGLISTS